MTEDHLSPRRAEAILEEKGMTNDETEHLKVCSYCNGWLRAIASLASSKGTRIEFEIPAIPDSN